MKSFVQSSFVVVILSVQCAVLIEGSAANVNIINNTTNNAILNSGDTALTAAFMKLSDIANDLARYHAIETTTSWQTNASTMVQAALIVHLEDFVMKMALRLQGVALYAMGKEQTLFHTPQSHMLELQNPRTFNAVENIFKLTVSWLKDLTDYSIFLNPSSATSLSNQWLAVNRIIRVSVRNSQVTQIDPRLVAAVDATVTYLSDMIEVTKVFVDYARRENFALTNLNQWNSLYAMISELHTDRRDMAVLDNVYLYNTLSINLENIQVQLSSLNEQFASTNFASQLNTFERSMKQVMNYALLTLKNSILYTDRLKSYSIIVTSNYFQRAATAAFWRLKFKDNIYFIKVVLEQSAQIDIAGMKSDSDTVDAFSEFYNIGDSYTTIINGIFDEVSKCTLEEQRSRACLGKLITATRTAISRAYTTNTNEGRKLSAATRRIDTALAATNRKIYTEGFQKALLF